MPLPLREAAASTLSSVPGTSPSQPWQPVQPETKWAAALLPGGLLADSWQTAAFLPGRLLADSRKQSVNMESYWTVVPRGCTEAKRRAQGDWKDDCLLREGKD